MARRRRGGTCSRRQATSILSRFRKHLAGRYTILELSPDLLNNAMKLADKHELRAYDAVQLAAAVALSQFGQGGVVLLSADRELNAAATAEGLTVDDPTTHT